MNFHNASSRALRATAAIALIALLGISGCKLSSKQKSSEARSEAKHESPADAIPALSSAASCIIDTLRDPKEPLHFSMLRKDDDLPGPFISEADLTPDTLEGSAKSSSGDVHKFSNVHTDARGWGMSVILLTAPLTSATGDMRMAQASVTSAGAESAGGFDTIKYVFDTARLPDSEQLAYKSMLNSKDLRVSGTAWITKDTRCMMKFVADFNYTAQNGAVSNNHYEGSLAKK